VRWWTTLAESSGGIAVVAIVWVFRKSLRIWAKGTYQTEDFYEVAKTACAEIAVLLFVFPLIDLLGKEPTVTIINNIAVTTTKRNWTLVDWSVAIGFVFIAIAGIFSKKQHDAGHILKTQKEG